MLNCGDTGVLRKRAKKALATNAASAHGRRELAEFSTTRLADSHGQAGLRKSKLSHGWRG